jgi:WD40 repeat protein
VAVAGLVVAACSSGDGSDAVTQPSASVAPEPPALPDGRRMLGTGRAVSAGFAESPDDLVVATTVGVQVVDGDADPVELSREYALALATDNTGLAAFTTAAGRLELWDVQQRRLRQQWKSDVDQIDTLHVVDGTVVAAGPDRVTLYGPGGSETVLIEAPSGGDLGPVAMSSRGELAVPVPGQRPWIATWSPGSDGIVRVDLGLTDGSWLNGVVWAPDSSRMAVLYGSPDDGDAVGMWDGSRLVPVTQLANLVLPEQLAFVDDDLMVFEMIDQVVAVDDSGHQLARLPPAQSSVQAILGQGDHAVVVRYDGSSVAWRPGSEPIALTTVGAPLDDVEQRGDTLLSTDRNGLVRRFDLVAAAPLTTLDRWVSPEVTSVDLSPAGDIVATATVAGTVRLLRLADGHQLGSYDQPAERVGDVAFSPDGERLATGLSVQIGAEAWDDSVTVSSLAGDEPPLHIGGESEDVPGCAFFLGDVAFSPDGQWLAASSHDFTVQVVDLASPDDVTTLEGHDSSILDLAFSPDGTRLVTSSDDSTVRVWDVDGWRLKDTLTGPPGGYRSIAFAPGSDTLAAADLAGELVLVDLDDGEVTHRFGRRVDGAAGLAYSPDGQTIVAAGLDGTVIAWSVGDGSVRTRLTGHTLPVTSIDVTADGGGVVTGSLDGTVRWWPLPG